MVRSQCERVPDQLIELPLAPYGRQCLNCFANSVSHKKYIIFMQQEFIKLIESDKVIYILYVTKYL